MAVKVVLMDIDGTMTGYKKTDYTGRSPLYLLETLVMEKHGLPRSEASAKILGCGDCEIHCLTEFLDQLQIQPEPYFKALCEDLEKRIYMPEDTKSFFKFLKQQSIPLYTATTNSEFISKAKMAVCGIKADWKKCDVFTGYYSGCFFRDPRGKFSPDFYPMILRHGQWDPDTVMMVGDEPERDMLPAMQSGIKYGITIDRTQQEPLIRKDGGCYINSLDVLQKMILELNGKDVQNAR